MASTQRHDRPFRRFDARPGGPYRLVLTYDEGLQGSGTTSDSDIVEDRFVEIAVNERIVQEVGFVSDEGRASDRVRALIRPLLAP